MSSVEEYYFGSAAWTDPDHVVSPTEAIWDAHKGEIGSDREIVIAYARSGTDGVRDAASVLVVDLLTLYTMRRRRMVLLLLLYLVRIMLLLLQMGMDLLL